MQMFHLSVYVRAACKPTRATIRNEISLAAPNFTCDSAVSNDLTPTKYQSY